jgi:hypothetical protein
VSFVDGSFVDVVGDAGRRNQRVKMSFTISIVKENGALSTADEPNEFLPIYDNADSHVIKK